MFECRRRLVKSQQHTSESDVSFLELRVVLQRELKQLSRLLQDALTPKNLSELVGCVRVRGIHLQLLFELLSRSSLEIALSTCEQHAADPKMDARASRVDGENLLVRRDREFVIALALVDFSGCLISPRGFRSNFGQLAHV